MTRDQLRNAENLAWKTFQEKYGDKDLNPAQSIGAYRAHFLFALIKLRYFDYTK